MAGAKRDYLSFGKEILLTIVQRDVFFCEGVPYALPLRAFPPSAWTATAMP
jgi:hypothetical protein